MKLLPKHVSNVGPDLSASFIDIPEPTKVMRKGTHSTEKYNPKLYLRKADSSLSAKNKSNLPPLFFEYKISIKTASSFPVGQYQNMASKLVQHQPPMHLSEIPLETKQMLMNESLLTDKKDFNSSNSPDSKSMQKPNKSMIQYTPSINLTDQNSKSILHPKTSTDLNSPYLLKNTDNSTMSLAAKIGEKEKSRRKWRKLSRRTIFNFEIDMVNNTVSMVREKRPGEEDDLIEKVKTKVKDEAINLSPHVQKKKNLENRERRPSIKVYYGLGGDSPIKNLASGEPVSNHEVKTILMNNKLRDNLKVSAKVRRFLKKAPMETAFDLNRIDLTKIDPANYFALYMTMRKAISPVFYSSGNEELNKIDPEMVEALQSESFSGAALTKYDEQIINQYRDLVVKAENEKIISGFWQNRKVYGNKPVCRESPGLASFEDKFYLFGGFGSDRMNDLWCLSGQTQGPSTAGCNWTLISPLGTKIPEKRYAHAMTSYNNEIYIFGGGGEFLTGLKMRVAMGDMWKYTIEDNQWREIDTRNTKYEKRMYAANCVIQGVWFIHGGTDGNSRNFLNTSVAYSFDQNKFIELILAGKMKLMDKIGPLAYHSAVSVMPAWLTHRPDNREYWTTFHKWGFSEKDPITVFF